MNLSTKELALDHLTVVDATPIDLVGIAAVAGYRAVCLFLESMEVLPRMPRFSLVEDAQARRATKARMDELGIRLDLAYPFTLASRTNPEDFARSLEAAAHLEARFVNVLAYDRDANRRLERLGQFSELAASFGLGVALEFFPLSQIRSLSEALEIVRATGAPGTLGINIDLLHLYRSGGTISELATTTPEYICYAQYCDAPLHRDAHEQAHEASADRMLAGDGALDIQGFSRALPLGCLASVEIPRDPSIDLGVSRQERAEAALTSVRRSIGQGPMSTA